MDNSIVRQIDELGRIVIPMQARHILDIDRGDEVEILVDGENIIFRKYRPVCVVCGQPDGVTVFRGKQICEGCRKEINMQFKVSSMAQR